MSHRNGHPKPNATERTHRRWRERKNISTVADEKHFSAVQEVKENILSWLNRNKPKEEEEPIKMAGQR